MLRIVFKIGADIVKPPRRSRLQPSKPVNSRGKAVKIDGHCHFGRIAFEAGGRS
jgi:hypothetical protein